MECDSARSVGCARMYKQRRFLLSPLRKGGGSELHLPFTGIFELSLVVLPSQMIFLTVALQSKHDKSELRSVSLHFVLVCSV